MDGRSQVRESRIENITTLDTSPNSTFVQVRKKDTRKTLYCHLSENHGNTCTNQCDYGCEQSPLESCIASTATVLSVAKGEERTDKDCEDSDGRSSLFHNFLRIIEQVHRNIW